MQRITDGVYAAAYAADARMEELPSGVSGIVGKIITEAYALYKIYSERGKELAAFARYIQHLAHVLEGIRYDVPEHALPVAQELDALVATGFEKHEKYEARGFRSTVWHLRSEKARLQSIMQGIQQLLPLLTVSVASAANVSAALADLQRRSVSLQGSSAEAATHLSHIRAAVEAVAASSGTAAEVEQRLADLRDSMMHLHEGCSQAILDGCGELQWNLGWGIAVVQDSVRQLHVEVASMSHRMLAAQGEIGADIKEMKGYLAAFCGLAASTADTMRPGRILAAIHELAERGGATAQPDTNANWAATMREAILAGKLAITSCLVLGVPLMHEGPLRPVTLPCCGFVVSYAGAQRLKGEGLCSICIVPLSENATLEDNEAVRVAVAAEARGFAPCLQRREDVTIGETIGAGGEATVMRGTLRGRPIAVKQVPLAEAPGAAEVAGVKHVVSTSYIAGVASPYVCKLHGYCWADSEIWLLMELCDGNLEELVRQVRKEHRLPGLPPLDVVSLGLMLCSALRAVHHRARCVHMDVTPRNILLVAGRGGRSSDGQPLTAGELLRRVKLADFGLAQHLPSFIGSSVMTTTDARASVVSDVGKGTAGYAPREQLLGTGQRRSDVYSLGACMRFALTGTHPFSGGQYAIIAKVTAGTPIPIPDHVEPAALKSLLTEMTAVEAETRPHLEQVEQRLRGVESELLAEACQPRFISPLRDTSGDSIVRSISASGVTQQHAREAVCEGEQAPDVCGASGSAGTGGDLIGLNPVGTEAAVLAQHLATVAEVPWQASLGAPEAAGERSSQVSNTHEILEEDADAVEKDGTLTSCDPHSEPQSTSGLDSATRHSLDRSDSESYLPPASATTAGPSGIRPPSPEAVHEAPLCATPAEITAGSAGEGSSQSRLSDDPASEADTEVSDTQVQSASKLGSSKSSQCPQGLTPAAALPVPAARTALGSAASPLPSPRPLAVDAPPEEQIAKCSAESRGQGPDMPSSPRQTGENTGERGKTADGLAEVSRVQHHVDEAHVHADAQTPQRTSRSDEGLDSKAPEEDLHTSAAIKPGARSVDSDSEGVTAADEAGHRSKKREKELQEEMMIEESAPWSETNREALSKHTDMSPTIDGGTAVAAEVSDVGFEMQAKYLERQTHQDVSSIHNVEDLFASLSAGEPEHTLDFGGGMLQLPPGCSTGLWMPSVTSCVGLRWGGGIIANATLVLGDEGAIALQGNSRVQFHNVTLQGGVLRCTGTQCDTTLKHVTFNRCRLVVTAGAKVNLDGGRALPLVRSGLDLCITRHARSRIHARGTKFDGSIAVLEGAKFSGYRVHVRAGGTENSGVRVDGEGSHVTLAQSEVTSANWSEAVSGVCASETALAELTDCSVTQVHTGVQIASGAVACLRGCRVDARGDGLNVQGPETRVEVDGGAISGLVAAMASASSVNEDNISFKGCKLGVTRKFDVSVADTHGDSKQDAAAKTEGPSCTPPQPLPRAQEDAAKAETRALKPRCPEKRRAKKVRTVEAMFACLHDESSHGSLDFDGRTIHLSTSWKAEADSCTFSWTTAPRAVAQLSSGGGRVTNVILNLGGDGALLLRGTSKVHFDDVTVQGGAIYCAGLECSTMFRNSSLKRCQLGAYSGASVKIHGGHVLPPKSAPSWTCQLQDAGSQLYATGARLYGSIGVHRGAVFTGENVSVILGDGGGHMHGIGATGAHSRVILRDSSISLNPCAAVDGRCAVVAHEHAIIELTDCTTNRVHRGIEAWAGAHAFLQGCKVQAEEYGLVIAGADTRVAAAMCRFSGGIAATATGTSVAPGKVLFQRCDVAPARTFDDGSDALAQRGQVDLEPVGSSFIDSGWVGPFDRLSTDNSLPDDAPPAPGADVGGDDIHSRLDIDQSPPIPIFRRSDLLQYVKPPNDASDAGAVQSLLGRPLVDSPSPIGP